VDGAADRHPDVTEDDVAALARVAGSSLSPERLAPLTAELNGTLAIVADLAAVPPGDLASALAPFDPVWSERVGGRR
jgi:hypothetical protein